MRRPRLTIRTLMVAVAALGVATWLGETAYRAWQDPWRMPHHHVAGREGGSVVVSRCDVSGFWPVFGRRLLGRPNCPTAGVPFASSRARAARLDGSAVTDDLISKAEKARQAGR